MRKITEESIRRKVRNKLVEEDFYTADIISDKTTAFKDEYTEVFKNPTKREINELSMEYDSIRGMIDDNNDVYIWRGNILHDTVDDHFPDIEFTKWQFIFETKTRKFITYITNITKHSKFEYLLKRFNVNKVINYSLGKTLWEK